MIDKDGQLNWILPFPTRLRLIVKSFCCSRSPLDFFIQNSLAQTDVMLLEKFLTLYQQLNAFKNQKEEPKMHRVNRFKMVIKLTTLKPLVATRSSEEKLKYAARRVDQIPSSRSEIDKIRPASFSVLKVQPEGAWSYGFQYNLALQ